MRADRLLSMLWLLMSHESLSAPDLARRLEVSPRTVLRDVEALSASGVPVYCERGRAGGVRLTPGFRTRVTGLTEDEARGVFLALASPVADSLSWGPAMASGLRKMNASMPTGQRTVVDDLARRLVIDPQGWLPTGVVPPLEPLLTAALEDRRIRIGYRSRSSGTTWVEVVDVYGLLAAGGSWYLVVGRAGEPRFLRVERIVSQEVLTETFDRPEGLDLRALWSSAQASYQQARFDPLEVLVEIPAAGWDALAELTVAIEDRGVGTQGRRRALLTFADRRHALGVVGRWGMDLAVLEPEWLRAELIDHARRVLAQYE